MSNWNSDEEYRSKYFNVGLIIILCAILGLIALGIFAIWVGSAGAQDIIETSEPVTILDVYGTHFISPTTVSKIGYEGETLTVREGQLVAFLRYYIVPNDYLQCNGYPLIYAPIQYYPKWQVWPLEIDYSHGTCGEFNEKDIRIFANVMRLYLSVRVGMFVPIITPTMSGWIELSERSEAEIATFNRERCALYPTTCTFIPFLSYPFTSSFERTFND